MAGDTLTRKEAFEAMNTIMDGEATPSQIASFLTVLRMREETPEEMIGFLKAMRLKAKSVHYDKPVIDTCGTGGDGMSTFNISTAVAIVLASIGVKVAKHGNRKVSSKSGSADVLEELGIHVHTTPEEATSLLDQHGLAFLFAPHYHTAMKHVAKARQEIGFRTLFNLLGPLANPLNPKRQLIGVSHTQYANVMAETLKESGSEHVLFVTGRDGLDELSITEATDITELKDGEIFRFVLTPEDVGLKRGFLRELKAESIQESAQLIINILKGTANDSATDIVKLNAGAALYISGEAHSIKEGVQKVTGALENGSVYRYYQSFSQKEVEVYDA